MTEFTALDALKFAAFRAGVVADTTAGLVRSMTDAYDRLAAIIAQYTDQPLPALQGVAGMVVEHVRTLETSIVPLAALHVDGEDIGAYSDGRPVMATVELGGGKVFRYVWHPDPQHADNQPHTVVEIDTAWGRRLVVIAGPGVLALVDPD